MYRLPFMNHVRLSALFLVAMLHLGCSDRLLTEQVWETDSQYYVIRKSGLTATQDIDLHNAVDGYRIMETKEELYVKKNWVNYYSDLTAKIMVTPMAVSLDIATIYIVGVISDPKALSEVITLAVSGAARCK